MSYNWFIVSKVSVNQLELTTITQTFPDILASNASAQFPEVSGVANSDHQMQTNVPVLSELLTTGYGLTNIIQYMYKIVLFIH